jgi:hypothetical protein
MVGGSGIVAHPQYEGVTSYKCVFINDVSINNVVICHEQAVATHGRVTVRWRTMVDKLNEDTSNEG